MAALAPIRSFKNLIVRQSVGNLNVRQEAKFVRISATQEFVVHCDDRTNAMVIYGLANCKYFSVDGESVREYIEQSTKNTITSSTTGRRVILENCIARHTFIGPGTDLTIRGARLNLITLTLDGNVSLTHIDNSCIDEHNGALRHMEINIRKLGALRCPLNVNRIFVRMANDATFSTYRLTEDQRYFWSISSALFEIDSCKRIEGLEVTKALTIKAPTQRIINALIRQDDMCATTLVPHALVLRDGNLPPAYAMDFVSPLGVFDEDDTLFGATELQFLRNGVHAPLTMTAVPRAIAAIDDGADPLDAVQQAILDESRVEYDTADTPLPLIEKSRRLKISGYTDIKDVPFTDVNKRCTICMENKSCILLSCGHRILCRKCTKQLLKYSTACPLCRKPTIYAVAVFKPK